MVERERTDDESELGAAVTGGADLIREIGQSWVAQARYSRDVRYDAGFSQPILYDEASGWVSGLIGRNVDVSTGVVNAWSGMFPSRVFSPLVVRSQQPRHGAFTNRDGLLRYWRGGVEENKDIDCIWPVGIRGTDDTGYTFPKGTSDAEQAKIFRDVLEKHVKMTKELLPPGREPIFHWTLYT